MNKKERVAKLYDDLRAAIEKLEQLQAVFELTRKPDDAKDMENQADAISSIMLKIDIEEDNDETNEGEQT